MNRPAADELLAKLLASAAGQPLDLVVLQAVISEASEAGAARALTALGLEDRTARRDMDELRELLVTWRDVKKSAWRTATRWIIRVALAMLMVGMAYQANLRDLLKS